MKKLMLGNEAAARGLYEAGCRLVSSYPGTPSTEITEEAVRYPEIYTEWAPNEKVAMETAFGASLAGARSACAMKHVGLNVAADPLFTVSYTGVNAGMVIFVADDPAMHSSQNEQDSRHYAIAAKLPMLEPSDSSEIKAFVKKAFEISEEFDCPVFVRMTTRLAHSQDSVETEERKDPGLKEYVKNPQKYVMAPANAIRRHPIVEERMKKLSSFGETTGLNRIEWADPSCRVQGTDRDFSKCGVITAGVSYDYVKEVFDDGISVLKLGMVNPLPGKLIRDFASKVETLYVIEDLDPVIETQVKAMGISCIGKDILPVCGEYDQRLLKNVFGIPLPDHFNTNPDPGRPPIMCAGCPHRGLFYILSKNRYTVIGDIGCYTLGAMSPLNAIDSVLCMGASVSGIHGFNKARGEEAEKKTVAVIGDSTFMHSGMTGLANIAYNGSNSTVIIMDNSITGMTGHQNNPTNGLRINGDPATAVDLEALVRAMGIDHVFVVDPYMLKETEAVIRREVAYEGPSVIISRRPCALLKSVKRKAPLLINAGKCRNCKACMRIGCPAIFMKDGRPAVDPSQCVGCGVCGELCAFGAIEGGQE
ncbi:MAG: indolepyruvate ferredoxin oxidoreductase subunit alpha [Lachnospiraceae bacterium]|nr:indolepyruvate ferredoxin oxidoreductase subunit alpha [Lachnospiraceae bacterium]